VNSLKEGVENGYFHLLEPGSQENYLRTVKSFVVFLHRYLPRQELDLATIFEEDEELEMERAIETERDKEERERRNQEKEKRNLERRREALQKILLTLFKPFEEGGNERGGGVLGDFVRCHSYTVTKALDEGYLLKLADMEHLNHLLVHLIHLLRLSVLKEMKGKTLDEKKTLTEMTQVKLISYF